MEEIDSVSNFTLFDIIQMDCPVKLLDRVDDLCV